MMDGCVTIHCVGIARPEKYMRYWGAGDMMAFGSWHPDACNFLVGDGSVRSIGVTTCEVKGNTVFDIKVEKP